MHNDLLPYARAYLAHFVTLIQYLICDIAGTKHHTPVRPAFIPERPVLTSGKWTALQVCLVTNVFWVLESVFFKVGVSNIKNMIAQVAMLSAGVHCVSSRDASPEGSSGDRARRTSIVHVQVLDSTVEYVAWE